jgi:integrase
LGATWVHDSGSEVKFEDGVRAFCRPPDEPEHARGEWHACVAPEASAAWDRVVLVDAVSGARASLDDVTRCFAQALPAAAFLRHAPGAAAAPATAKGLALRDYALKQWLPSREGRIASHRDDLSHLRDHVLPLVGDVDVALLTRDDVERVRDDLDRRLALASDAAEYLAWKTATNIWTTFTKMLADMATHKRRELRVRPDANLAAGVKAPDRGANKAKQYLYPSEVSAFLACERIPLTWKRAVAVAVYLGARDGELRALTWDCVDLEHATIHVHKAWDRRAGSVGTTKSEVTRRVAIEPELLPLLSAMHEQRTGEGAVLELPSERDMARGLRRWLRHAGVARDELFESSATTRPIRFHDLRATYCTWAAIRGDAPQLIMQRAGHEHFETTLGYVRTAEALRAGFGTPFPPLPTALTGQKKNVPSAPIGGRDVLRGGRDSNPHKGGEPPDRVAVDALDDALAYALREAVAAARWDVVAQLASAVAARTVAGAR